MLSREALLVQQFGNSVIRARPRQVANQRHEVGIQPMGVTRCWPRDDQRGDSSGVPADLDLDLRLPRLRDAIQARFIDPDDPLKIVIVRDMWLTGFDAPSANTLYVDKPMKGHTLMQAIARVNCIFRDKPGGLIVDFIGIGDELKAATRRYTAGGGRGNLTEDLTEQAVHSWTISSWPDSSSRRIRICK